MVSHKIIDVLSTLKKTDLCAKVDRTLEYDADEILNLLYFKTPLIPDPLPLAFERCHNDPVIPYSK